MFEKQRHEMVEKWVVAQGITDERVVAAMSRVPRHLFVEAPLQEQAYWGKALPIGYGQTISHPTTVALMTALLQLNGDEKVLEIGTGSGYQTAILAEMAGKVYSVERIRPLGERARKILETLGYVNVAILIGDGTMGWPRYQPYDAIIVTAAASEIPVALQKQLAPGGRMVIPVGNESHQELQVVTRTETGWQVETIPNFQFVPLKGKERK